MATPDHIPDMTSLDRRTVVLYRLGLSIFTFSILLKSIDLLAGMAPLGEWYIALVATGAALASANIHLYDPTFRWLMPMMSWLGLIALAFSIPTGSGLLLLLSLGFFYAGLGMMAVKEQFCFKIPGLMFVPVFLLLALILQASGMERAAGIPLGIAALLYLVLALAKWRMPLHFDIGDKSYYRI